MGPMSQKFKTRARFCTMHLAANFHHHMFNHSKVIVLTNNQTNKQMPLKTSTSRRYNTSVGNKVSIVFLTHDSNSIIWMETMQHWEAYDMQSYSIFRSNNLLSLQNSISPHCAFSSFLFVFSNHWVLIERSNLLSSIVKHAVSGVNYSLLLMLPLPLTWHSTPSTLPYTATQQSQTQFCVSC